MANEWAWAGIVCILLVSGVYLLTLRDLKKRTRLSGRDTAAQPGTKGACR